MEYLHGGDSFRLGAVTDFSININPLGMPTGAKAAAIRGISDAGRYPDWRHEALIHAISSRHGISEREIIVGNGASELFYALTLSYRRPIRAWIPAPTFREYEEAVLAAGGRLVSDAPFTEKNEKIAENCDMIFLCNPNNPTGALYDTEKLRAAFRRIAPTDALIVLDESFLDFVPDADDRSFLFENELRANVLIVRSMTKLYGMPGLRLGYAATKNEALLADMRRVLQPWNLSLPAEYAGCAALSDTEFLEKTRQYVEFERTFLKAGLERLVRRVEEGHANFLFFQDEPELSEKLLEKGILIRNCANIRGLSAGDFRIGVRTREENQRLLEALADVKRG